MIDLYCERTTAGLWAEPVNVASNIGYVFVAFALWRSRGGRSSSRSTTLLLAGLILMVGLGSAMFHMLATSSARALDEGPIIVLQVTFLWLYARRVMRLTSPIVVLITLGLVVSTVLARVFVDLWNGSAPYLPVFILTVAFGLDHLRANRHERFALLIGSLVFMTAIVCRTVDNAVCSAFPIGTHFLWHLATALVLYLFSLGLLRNLDTRPE